MDFLDRLGYESFKRADIIDKFDSGGCRASFEDHKISKSDDDFFDFCVGWNRARREFGEYIKVQYVGSTRLSVRFIVNLLNTQLSLFEKLKMAMYSAAHSDNFYVDLPPMKNNIRFVLDEQRWWTKNLKLTPKGYAIALCLCESDEIKQKVLI